jgi:hypothetical protein
MNENYDHQHQNVRKENNIQYGDLAEFMDFEYMKKVTCSNSYIQQFGLVT